MHYPLEKSPAEIYEDLKNGLLEIKEVSAATEPEGEEGEAHDGEDAASGNVDFDEMYLKVFND